MKRKLLLLLALLTLLPCGCAQEEDGPALGSQLWETQQLTYGVMEYDKLQVLPWDSGRCEATSFEFMAETRDGYYLCGEQNRKLLYADKVSLDNWVPVCNLPNCSHQSMYHWSYGQTVCHSEIEWGQFIIRDGRIWFLWSPKGREFEDIQANQVLMSMNPDGTDRRIECVMDTGATSLVSCMSFLSSEEILYNEVVLNADGSITGSTYRVVGEKTEEIATAQFPEDDGRTGTLQSAFYYHVYGDKLIYNRIEVNAIGSFVRIRDGQREILDLNGLHWPYAYLSGDTLRCFRTNDGYYDADIRTCEEVKLADCQLENSKAVVALPNCILESSLLHYDSLRSRAPGQTHSLMLFDGESWREVTLPKELQVTDTGYLDFKCVTSDSVLFLFHDDASGVFSYANAKTDLYRIDLTQKKLKLEFVTQLDGYIQ